MVLHKLAGLIRLLIILGHSNLTLHNLRVPPFNSGRFTVRGDPTSYGAAFIGFIKASEIIRQDLGLCLVIVVLVFHFLGLLIITRHREGGKRCLIHLCCFICFEQEAVPSHWLTKGSVGFADVWCGRVIIRVPLAAIYSYDGYYVLRCRYF